MAMVSVTEYAQAEGISRQAAHKRVKSGKIPIVNGKIDLEAAQSAWGRNRAPEAIREKKKQASVAAPDVNEVGYNSAKSRREVVRLKKEYLQLQRMEGEMVLITEVNAFVSDMIVHARDILLRMPGELRDRLAKETDPVKCEKMLQAEVDRCLSGLAEYRNAR